MTLLLDALDRTLRAPASAPRWHALMAIWLETPDEATQRSVLNALQTLPDSDARADILRLTFLASQSGECRFESAAAARVLAAQPSDPDRLAAFMAYRWLSALQSLEGRSEFIAALSAGRLPEMARRPPPTADQ